MPWVAHHLLLTLLEYFDFYQRNGEKGDPKVHFDTKHNATTSFFPAPVYLELRFTMHLQKNKHFLT